MTSFRMLRTRLIAAIRRHGLIPVARVVLVTVVRRGLFATLRLGGAHRPFPWQDRKRDAGPARRELPADLDEAYTLDAAGWARWRDIVGGSRPQAYDQTEAATLLFVVRGPEPAPGDRQRTAEAIAGAGPAATLWSPGATIGAARFVVFLRPGDLPSPDMARSLAAAARGGVAEVITFDMFRRVGDRVQPLLLPGVNPTLLRAADFVFSRLAVAPDLLGGGGDLEALDPRALALGWMKGRSAQQTRGRWRHVDHPVVEANLDDETIAGVRREALAHGRRPAPPHRGEPISVIICTKDKGHLTRQLVRSLLTLDPSLVGEVVIVSNDTTNPYALAALEDLAREARVRVMRRDGPFNFSRLNNAGVRETRGRGPILFLNDDIVPVTEDWLQRLAARLEDPATGSVGPLLLYPDEQVQHAGVYLGYKGGAGHILRAARLPANDYLLTGCASREVSALTGAALLTQRAAFEALGGFDEQLALAFQDIDLGLRLRAAGLVNVFEPASTLIHMESASVKSLGGGSEVQRLRQAERMRFVQRWGELVAHDPLHPRGFDPQDEALRRLTGPDGQRPPRRG
jgi:GT2 family glycosyltransferase